jgi:hypothetical protein
MYACMCLCVYVCVCICVCMCMYMCMYVCIYVCLYACACMYICMYQYLTHRWDEQEVSRSACVIGGGFAGLACAYFLTQNEAFSGVTVYDCNLPGEGGASAVAAGMVHPFSPRGKLIWKGLEALHAALDLIQIAQVRAVCVSCYLCQYGYKGRAQLRCTYYSLCNNPLCAHRVRHLSPSYSSMRSGARAPRLSMR